MSLPVDIDPGITTGHVTRDHAALHTHFGLPARSAGTLEHLADHRDIAAAYFTATGLTLPVVADATSHELVHEELHAWYNGLPTDLPGWERTKANSDLASKGLDPAAFTVYSGSLSPSNVTITRQRINLGAGEVLQLGSNVVLDECEIRATAHTYAMIRTDEGSSGQRILGCDIISDGTPGTVRSVEQKLLLLNGSTNTKVIGGYAQGGTIALEFNNYSGSTADTGDEVTDWCLGGMQWSLGRQEFNEPHVDGFTRRAGISRLLVRRCRFDIGFYVESGYTGACFLQPTYAAIGGARFEDCLFSGGGYDLAVESGTTWEVVNNRFGDLHYGPGYKYAGAGFAAWSSNNVYAAGSPPEYRGATVAAFT